MSVEAAFSRIIASRAWGSRETLCGPGSTIEACQAILEALPKWIAGHRISSIADLGCGDFHWMSQLDLTGIQYAGYDVVRDLISANRVCHSAQNIHFHHADFMAAPVPKVDLVICKDVLAHLPTSLALDALAAIRRGGSRFLAATTAVGWGVEKREGTQVGGFSPIDLEQSPFHLGAPLSAVDVPMKPGNPRKLFALWDLEAAHERAER